MDRNFLECRHFRDTSLKLKQRASAIGGIHQPDLLIFALNLISVLFNLARFSGRCSLAGGL